MSIDLKLIGSKKKEFRLLAMKEGYEKLNRDIYNSEHRDIVSLVTPDMNLAFSGISRKVFLNRYSVMGEVKGVGDIVLTILKPDPKYPTYGEGKVVKQIDDSTFEVEIIEEDRVHLPEESFEDGIIIKKKDELERPLELFWEQTARRIARGVSLGDEELEEEFYEFLLALDIVPAGRVLRSAGTDIKNTWFNCYVMPFIPDSREGIGSHITDVMEIMSRGGGVGTNGSTLRPRNTKAKSVNGKSSGSVTWLEFLSKLTNQIEQGGSRRGAQMIMKAIWHPDVVEFILCKMQNPNVLRYIIEKINDPLIKKVAKEKLDFKPLSEDEKEMLEFVVKTAEKDSTIYKKAEQKLNLGGTYSVKEPEFMAGANISTAITDDFMDAVERDDFYELRFPDVENYNEEEMKIYDEKWHEVGDVRKWEEMGFAIKTHYQIKAKDLWELINICATFCAEPGIFFIDRANKDTNAQAYGQQVVATNPCGEQPLAPWSVCNLLALNLANMANKKVKKVDYEKIKKAVRTAIKFQDNVINATPYFLEKNKEQAFNERRIGLGVMGLHDLLIFTDTKYGSKKSLKVIDKIFETIAVTAYETSIQLGKEKGSFPLLIGKTEAETQKLRTKFINSGYMKRMPEHIRKDVLKFGIRNSHLLTVAPTGSTGTMVGVSTGLEPYFGFKYFRSGRLGKFIEVNAPIVSEYLKENPEFNEKNLPEWFVTAMDLTPEAHVDVQCTIQRWIDSSISKTVNAPRGYTVEQVQKVYERLYKGGAKGGTVYVDGSRESQVLTLFAEENNLDKVVVDDILIEEVQPQTKNKKIGSEVGNTCSVCKIGTVIKSGGCNTCNNCNAQLSCGL